MTLVPRHIQDLLPYKAGKPIEELRRELGLKKIVKLASNENPLGVSPLAQKAMKAAIKESHRYPPSDGYGLRKALADQYDVKMDNVILGHGSEGIISVIMRTFLLDDEEAVTSQGSFITFDLQAQSRGIKLVRAPLNNYCIDLDNVAAQINEKTKLIYLANPNNPTGTIFRVHQFLDFIKNVPSRALVILDEAYFEFARYDPTFPDSMQYRLDNVITLRTFSKSYGLAGLRLGYGFAHADLISNLMKVKLSFEPSSLAIAAGIAAMKDDDFLNETLRLNRVGLEFFARLFDELSLHYLPSHANFMTIVLESEDHVNRLYDKLLHEGVIVRPLKAFGLPNCIRVSTGLTEENEFFAEKLRKVI